MDSLALLCNLYGDGPATVRRLREAGLGSLQAIDAAEAERLASLLRTSVRSAQRFRAEGRLLLERTTAAVEPAFPTEEGASGGGDPLLRKVLDAWRRKDAEEAEDAEDAEGSGDASGDASDPTVDDGPAVAPAPRVEAPDGPEGVLSEGDLDGLDAEAVEALARAEVTTLDQLARCDALALSARSGLAYTRLLRLALLGRRARAERAPASVEELAVEEVAGDVLEPAPPRGRPGRDPRFSPSEGPSEERAPPLEPLAAPRVDRRAAAAGARPAPPPDESLESAGPFA